MDLAIKKEELKYKRFYWITVSGDRDSVITCVELGVLRTHVRSRYMACLCTNIKNFSLGYARLRYPHNQSTTKTGILKWDLSAAYDRQ